MKIKLVILSTLLTLASCSVIDNLLGGGSSMFNLGAAAVESLPQVRSSGASTNKATNIQMAAKISGSIQDVVSLTNFFKLECFMPDGDNFCPTGVDTSGGDSNPYKLSSYTLIGSIYHADLYSGGSKTACEGTVGTISPSSFSTADAAGDPTKFILDYYSLLSCVSEEVETSGKTFHAYSVDPDQNYQATLTTHYRIPYNGVANPGQNDILQVYVGLNAGTPKFLAFNYAGADTLFQRTILLVNTETHKFAVKHTESATNYLVAIGVGGADRATGTLNPGYYYTKFTNGTGSEDDGCVDNATGNFEATTTACSDASIPITWTSSDSVADYLGMTADDKSRLAAFLGKFTDQSPLAAADAPTNSTTDVEMDIPKSITP